MPIYMDVHIVPGVKSTNVAEAHRLDMRHQQEFACKCMTYWVDEERETVFCLIEAPDKDAVKRMHSKAHGLIPNKIIEVSSGVVSSFLGRIYDPEDATISDDGLKFFSDSSFRILLVTKTSDPVLLEYELGADKATELLNRHNDIIRKNRALFGGSEAEHSGNGFIISFASAAKAISCALAIQKEMPTTDANSIGFRMGVNAGEPLENSSKLFGDTIQLAAYMCAIAKHHQIALTSAVKELISKDHLQNGEHNFLCLSPNDEALLKSLFNILELNWQDAEFDITEYCQSMAMSKSQLYRKTIALTGMAPNIFFKEFRLEKAKELMKKKRHSISQITFDSGFASPSYFTKCFKKKYGLLPMTYLELMH